MNILERQGRSVSLLVSLAVFLVGLLSLGVAPSAHAGALIMTCEGTDSATFTPGLTDTQQNINYAVAVSLSCPLGGIGAPAGLNSGAASSMSLLAMSCNDLATGPFPLPATYNWNNGSQSVVEFELVEGAIVDGSIVLSFTGSVTSGLGQGSLVDATVTLPNVQGILSGCTGSGLTSLSGPTTVTFLGL